MADLLGRFCGGFCVFFGGGFAADFCKSCGGFCGGFAADFSKSCGGFCGVFLRRICSGPKPCKLHVKIAPKIHHKNPPHSSPHARLVCDYTLPAFFTACFAACPSTGILHYVTYTADFFRGGFCLADFARRISSAADFFRGFRWPSVINYTSDVIGVICRIWGAVIQLAMPPWLCFKCLFTLPVSCVMFQKSVKKSTPNFCTPSRDNTQQGKAERGMGFWPR